MAKSDEQPGFNTLFEFEQILDRFEAEWRSGQKPDLNQYLELVPEASRPALFSELLSLELDYRREAGEAPQDSDYLAKFPQFAEQIQRCISESTPGKPSRDSQRSRRTQGTDRNLLFGIMALQMDFIGRDALIEALRDWTTQKDQPVGQILVERGDLSVSRRELLEPLVDEHVRQHDHDPAASLAAISSVIDAEIDWRSVVDADVAASLAARRHSRNAKRSEGVSAADDGGATASADRFRVLRPHARGGIGEVFLAFDQELHREVALKEIQSRHLRDESHRERFVREAEVTGGLEHPGIVPVYSLGHYGDGRPFYAMRFIRGDSLKEAIEKFHANRRTGVSPVIAKAGELPAERADVNAPTVIKPEAPGGWALLPAPAAPQTPEDGQECPSSKNPVSREQFASVDFRKLLGRFIDVCQAIEYAHSRGVLHRDLKPGNIMLGKYGETLVVDWGLAKAAGKAERFADSEEATFVPSSGSGVEQTQQGSVVGTPSYMSPEQAAGKLDQLGPTTDVYSLGATLYHLLTGQPPFTAQPRRPGTANAPAPPKLSVTELLRRVEHGDFPRPREIISHIPKPLEAICLKAMSLHPEDRYASSSALAEDIEYWLAEASEEAARMRRLLYTAHMNLAQMAWENNQLARVLELLESHRPQEDQDDLRGFEWFYWDRKCHSDLLTLHGHSGYVTNVAFSPDGNRLASASFDETVKVGDATSGQMTLTLKGHTGWVTSVTFSPDGKRLESAGDDGTVKVWDATSGQEMLTLKAAYYDYDYHDCIHSVAFSPDGKRLVSGGSDCAVKVWDSTSGQEMLTLKGHTDVVYCVVFSPDGKRLASASGDGTVKVWDATSSQETLTLKGHADGISSVAFSPDGKWLASASSDQTVKVWNATSGQETLTLIGHTDSISSVAYSADGKRLASASADQTVKVWDVTNSQKQLRLKDRFWRRLGEWIRSTTSGQKSLTLQAMLTLTGHNGRVSSVAFSPDGTRLASASGNGSGTPGEPGEVKVWDATSGQEILTLKGHTDRVTSIAFSPDGKRLASASSDRTVKVWDAASGQETLTLKGHNDGVGSVAFSPDGKRLASGSTDQTVKLWDVTSGQETLTLKGHVSGVAFSADGKRLVSGSNDGTVKVWDA